MATHLDEILAVTRRVVAERKESANLRLLEQRAAAHTPRGFAQTLRHYAVTGPAIIAELKKASPSRGLIRAEFAVEPLAQTLAASGAAALSVLTEEHFFQGSLANLEQASAVASVPCLRKDFIVDEFQILESRAACADAILLIAAALDDTELRSLTNAAHAHGLDVLCEVHNAEEAARVLDLGADAVGVNNRNLKTFEVRLETSIELAAMLPANIVRVAESGIHKAADLVLLRHAGYAAFLIGESLMRQADPGQALRSLLAEVAQPGVGMREVSA
ncbi:MAG TPA: indole-3-glycerol phosphate synthase TrpC [Acidobacteriaceae bacterium]|jgi:indole-3-glycerol phosphate synthase|nr:indole-3-glycerol phosphate synthase TrpC [Acidobacteriaceae bacterium]